MKELALSKASRGRQIHDFPDSQDIGNLDDIFGAYTGQETEIANEGGRPVGGVIAQPVGTPSSASSSSLLVTPSSTASRNVRPHIYAPDPSDLFRRHCQKFAVLQVPASQARSLLDVDGLQKTSGSL